MINIDTSVALAQLLAEDRRLSRPVLARAQEPFAKPVRTLDALHLASMDFLRRQGQEVQLASYDERLVAAAKAMSIGAMVL